jgi:hypothetical protein
MHHVQRKMPVLKEKNALATVRRLRRRACCMPGEPIQLELELCRWSMRFNIEVHKLEVAQTGDPNQMKQRNVKILQLRRHVLPAIGALFAIITGVGAGARHA